MAGHPTIGSTFALAHTGVICSRAGRAFVFGLNIGPTPVDLEWDERPAAVRVDDAAAVRSSARRSTDRAAVAAALGLDARRPARRTCRFRRCRAACRYLFVPLRDRETVDRAISDVGRVPAR